MCCMFLIHLLLVKLLLLVIVIVTVVASSLAPVSLLGALDASSDLRDETCDTCVQLYAVEVQMSNMHQTKGPGQ